MSGPNRPVPDTPTWGWNAVARKNGCSGSSIASTPASGAVAPTRRPRARAARRTLERARSRSSGSRRTGRCRRSRRNAFPAAVSPFVPRRRGCTRGGRRPGGEHPGRSPRAPRRRCPPGCARARRARAGTRHRCRGTGRLPRGSSGSPRTPPRRPDTACQAEARRLTRRRDPSLRVCRSQPRLRPCRRGRARAPRRSPGASDSRDRDPRGRRSSAHSVRW